MDEAMESMDQDDMDMDMGMSVPEEE
jgi:hypothetical protein